MCVGSRFRSCLWAGAQISPYQAFIGGRDFTANQFYNFFGPILGVPDASHGATEDLIADALVCAFLLIFSSTRAMSAAADLDTACWRMQGGSANAMAGQALNVEVLNSLVTGSALLTGLKPGVTANQVRDPGPLINVSRVLWK